MVIPAILVICSWKLIGYNFRHLRRRTRSIPERVLRCGQGRWRVRLPAILEDLLASPQSHYVLRASDHSHLRRSANVDSDPDSDARGTQQGKHKTSSTSFFQYGFQFFETGTASALATLVFSCSWRPPSSAKVAGKVCPLWCLELSFMA